MQSISFETAKREKLIRFMTPEPFMASTDAFFLKDGGSIRITSGYDGKVTSHICKYLDPHHFQVSGNTFHMDQFSEVMHRSQNTYAPALPLIDLRLFNKVYCDRTLADSTGKLIPYREVIFQTDPNARNISLFRIAICPDADALRTACILSRKQNGEEDRMFLSLQALRQKLSDGQLAHLNRWDRQSLDAVLTDLLDKKRKADLENRIVSAAQRTADNVRDDGLITTAHSR